MRKRKRIKIETAKEWWLKRKAKMSFGGGRGIAKTKHTEKTPLIDVQKEFDRDLKTLKMKLGE